jgi:hypothetical protein
MADMAIHELPCVVWVRQLRNPDKKKGGSEPFQWYQETSLRALISSLHAAIRSKGARAIVGECKREIDEQKHGADVKRDLSSDHKSMEASRRISSEASVHCSRSISTSVALATIERRPPGALIVKYTYSAAVDLTFHIQTHYRAILDGTMERWPKGHGVVGFESPWFYLHQFESVRVVFVRRGDNRSPGV